MESVKTVKPCPAQGIRSSKETHSVNLRWMNLILYGINGDLKRGSENLK